jgi:LmbE family N-acetylglucosaminyl deacetylase
MKINCWAFILLSGVVTESLRAQTSSEIFHQMQALPVCGSVLYVAAHPDDENTRLISYLTRELHLRTAYLSLTRGDGGQNLIGSEQGEALGVLRTQELLQARKIDGGEQYFTTAFDFGYSKSAEETFRMWDKEKVLADAVWIIRNFQPDIIICRFPTTGEGGHGHHTASAIIAEEAFVAAADSHRFREQLSAVSTWQAKRLLWNTFNFGNINTTAPDQLQINVGGYHPLLGKSFGEIAAESRSCHSSQAFGTAKNRNSQTEFFTTISGDVPKQSLTDGVDISFQRFGNTYLMNVIHDAIKNFDFQHPAASVPLLVKIYDAIEKENNIPRAWKDYKLSQLKQIILSCCGIHMEAVSSRQFAAVGDTLKVKIEVVNRSDEKIVFRNFFTSGVTTVRDSVMPKYQTISATHVLWVNENHKYSQPYWLEKPRENAMFEIDHRANSGKAWNEPAITYNLQLNISGKDFDFSLPVYFKKIDPSKGEVYQPLYITPPITVNFLQDVFIATSARKEIALKVRAFKSNLSGKVSLSLPEGWFSITPSQSFALKHEGDESIITFSIQSKSTNLRDSIFFIRAIANIYGNDYSKSFQEIRYEHIPYTILLNECVAKLATVDMKTASKKIGYLAGAGDKIPQLLKEIGIEVTELSTADLPKTDLRNFDAIIAGVRAYNTDERLKNTYSHLMNYVKNGGTFLVQYNTNQNLITNEIGPYPFKISRNRVTDETASVTFINPKDRLLNYPNKITQKDFEHWVQERGLYFPEEIDSRYKTILSMNDLGEKALENGIIYCRLGKGKFIYTSLSFFRQLPAGVPGAIRLFANLIAPR